MTAIGSTYTNPYYGINQAGGVKPTDAAAAGEKAKADAAIAAAATPETKPDVAQGFLDYAKLSIPERIRKSILEKKGLSEEQLAQLEPEERKKIEEEIKEEIKKAIEDGVRKKVGDIADITV